jgi:hypothetical protein
MSKITLNEKFLKHLDSSSAFRQTVPDWIVSALNRPLAQVQQLPAMTDSGEEGTIFRPTFETLEITASYLDFLRGEIQAELRGKKWSDFLSLRLQALAPFEKKVLYQLMIGRVESGRVHTIWIALHPDDFRAVHVEG